MPFPWGERLGKMGKILVWLGILGLLTHNSKANSQAFLGTSHRSFPATTAQIAVFSDQLPSEAELSPAQWQFIATHYVGTQKETRRWAERVRRLNPHFIILHYQLAVGAGPANFLDGNQWTNDFKVIVQHPNWFLRNEEGQPIQQNAYHWDVMNILFRDGKPICGWPAYWVATALKRLRDNEDDGVFADSYTQDILMGQVEPAFPWFESADACKQNWIPNLNLFGAYCCRALHAHPEHFYYLPNLGGLVNSWDTTNYAVGDGGMNEGFALAGPGRYYSTQDWRLQMNRLLELNLADKIVLCQSYIRDTDEKARWFVVGSYSLIKGHHTYINMFERSTLSWYPEYTLDLGKPSEPSPKNVDALWNAAWGVYERSYEKGTVLVNPSSMQVAVSLDRAYLFVRAEGGGPVPPNGNPIGKLTTERVQQVVVPPHGACVLLFSTAH